MMRSCVLHVGMHKTGSTSIQYSLYQNPTLQGATYLDLGLPNPSGLIRHGFDHREQQTSPHFPRRTPEWLQNRARRVRKQLIDALSAAGPRSILSAEDASHLRLDEARELKQLLLSQVDYVGVLAYVREARGFMESMFQQNLKGGAQRLHLPGQYPRYRFCFQKYDQLFGRENVQLVPFQPKTFVQKCVVHDFCLRTGVSIDPSTIRRANEGMSRHAAALLLNYRQRVQDHAWNQDMPANMNALLRVDRYVVSGCMELEGPKVRFAPDLLASVFAEQREDLNWMAQRIGFAVDGVGSTHADDIQSEADLLTLRPEAIAWLSQRTGHDLAPTPSDSALNAALRQLRQQAIDRVLAEGPGVPPIKVSA
jgi:hypothetical protein